MINVIQNVRNLSHPVRIRWIKLSNLAIFIYIAGYLDVRKMSETLFFRTFVGALSSIKDLSLKQTKPSKLKTHYRCKIGLALRNGIKLWRNLEFPSRKIPRTGEMWGKQKSEGTSDDENFCQGSACCTLPVKVRYTFSLLLAKYPSSILQPHT